MNSEHQPSKTQKTILIAVIVALIFLALAEGILLLRSTYFQERQASFPMLSLFASPRHPPKADYVLGEEENLMLQETAEDLERLHSQINRLFNHRSPFPPFDNMQRLQSEIGRIFQNAREGRHGAALSLLEKDWQNVATTSSLNIQESETNYVVAISLPGFEKNEISITVHERLLTIAAQKEQQQVANQTQTASFGHFKTQIMLPPEANGEAAEALYQDGVLKVTVPKAPATNSLARKVTIM